MMQNQKRTANRCGYTLVELIIAAVLVAALMSTIWGVMSMYNSFLTAGQSQATEQQLVRSLFQLIAEDLGTALPPQKQRQPAPVVLSAEENAFADLADLADIDEAATQPEPSVLQQKSDTTNPASPLFIGTSTAIRITTHKMVPQAHGSELSDIDQLNELGGGSISSGNDSVENETPTVSEFQTVVYQFQPRIQSETAGNLPAGLYRIQVDSLDLLTLLNNRSTMQQSVAQHDVQVDHLTLQSLLFPEQSLTESVANSESEFESITQQIVPHFDLVPEVVACQFEYFDGVNWVSQWSSGESDESTYPAAVRIRFDVINAEELEKLSELDSPSLDSQQMQQELNDSFSASQESISNSTTADADSQEDELSLIAGIKPRRYWRIILLENPQPEFDATGFDFSSDFAEDFQP